MREDQLCPFASKCQTSIRRPCLHEDGPPLRRMGGGQSAVGPHLRAIVAHIVNLRRVSEYAAFAIDLERTHFPAVPERDACFPSFVGHVVSDILVRQSISSIGLGFLAKGRRDNIPPRSDRNSAV